MLSYSAVGARQALPQASLIKGRFGGIVNMTGVAKLCFASPFIRTNLKDSNDFSRGADT